MPMLATDLEFDLDELLSDLATELPCGEDLEYDPAFGEMERAAEPKAEQQFGDTIIPGEGPEWRDVLRHAQELFGRTRDLRVAVYLAQASLATQGLPAFGQTVTLLRGLIEKHWEHVHPQLDPDDDNDPTIRVNTLATLCDADTTLALLRATPLVASRTVGRFSYRDILIAQGDLSAPEDEEAPDMGVIGAAFMDVDVDDVQSAAQIVDQLLDDVQHIESQVTELVGVGNAASFEPLRSVLRELQQVYQDQLQKRGVVTDGVAADDDQDDATGAGTEESGGGNAARLTGQITCREDVVRALDKIMDYYRQCEPSSPLPLLLNRAKRLANADFLTIVKDLAPEGFDQAEAIGGASSSGDYDDDDSDE